VVGDLGCSAGGAGGRGGAVNTAHGAMAVAEVSVTGLADVCGPGGAALVGKVVVVDLFAGDDEDLLFGGGADEQTLIDECVISGGFGGVRGIGLNREFDRVGPETGWVSAVVIVESVFEVECVVGIFVAACGQQDQSETGCGVDQVSGDETRVHRCTPILCVVGCRSCMRCAGRNWLPGGRIFQSQPLVRAMRAASMRLEAPSLAIASER